MTTLQKKINIFSRALVLGGMLSVIACASQMPCSETAAETEVGAEIEAPVVKEADKIAIFKSYQQAAAQGNARAQYNLGLWYEEGHPGQARDLLRAYVWYRLSASQGALESQYALERFEAQLTPVQRAEAERLINKWTRGDTLEK